MVGSTAKKAPPIPTALKAPAVTAVSKTAPASSTPGGTGQTAPANNTATQPATSITAQEGTSVATKKAAAAAAATATKATASALAVREGEEAWTQAELDEVLDELREQRVHSLQILAVQEAELSGLMKDPGDGAGQDQADMGATSFERDHELTVLNSERDKLAQIERALIAISEGTYGICESCGQPIGKMRLMAFPRATLCVTCKQREERR
ncbi:TraR/DksA family transcriptional regulator [Nocardioides panacihumi]|uniref:TraR/DksA family transcriptional regulator n=1 Tax=Nocardioides panacihumi TaxID=400774 RepID=A0ABP5CBL7_9ACTN